MLYPMHEFNKGTLSGALRLLDPMHEWDKVSLSGALRMLDPTQEWVHGMPSGANRNTSNSRTSTIIIIMKAFRLW